MASELTTSPDSVYLANVRHCPENDGSVLNLGVTDVERF